MNIEDIPQAVVDKIIQIKSDTVTVRPKPEEWIKSMLKRGSTNETIFNDILNPDIEFENPKKTPVVIKAISLIPDNNFKGKGKIKVIVGSFPVFENESHGDCINTSEILLDIPNGLILNRDEKIKIFLESSDDTIISITAQITLGM